MCLKAEMETEQGHLAFCNPTRIRVGLIFQNSNNDNKAIFWKSFQHNIIEP